MQNKFILGITWVVLLLSLAACSDDVDDPEIENEEELITSLYLTLTDQSGGAYAFTFYDLDGDGGDAPVMTTAPLPANSTFTASIELLNEAEDPAEVITEEIEEEDDEHQFFYIVSGANLTVSYDDEDDNGNPIGIKTNMTSGDVSTGTLQVILRHEPAKDAAGVSDGQIANAGGESDIEVSFPIVIQ